MSHAAVAAHIGSLGGPPSATEAATMAQSLGHNSADAVHCFMCASQVSCRPNPSLTIAPVRVRTCSSARIRVRARSRACVSARRRVHVHTLEWRRRVRAHTPACARVCVALQACGEQGYSERSVWRACFDVLFWGAGHILPAATAARTGAGHRLCRHSVELRWPISFRGLESTLASPFSAARV